MKKTIFILLALAFVALLSASHLTPMELNNALSLSYGGELRTRGIMNNDLNENDGGWFDNRLWLNLQGKIGERVGLAWNTEVGDILWQDFGNKDVSIETRELYMDYQMDWMDMKVRLGQQYWYDHRSLILDDYFSGITSDLTCANMPLELGYVKVDEGQKISEHIDDAQMAFGNITFKMPVDWGLTLMYGQHHVDRTADIWAIPYFMFDFAPVKLDLTAILNDQMYKKIADGKKGSEMGIGLAAKLEFDMAAKLGLDFLYVTKEGLNNYSPYYVNGLYLFGNQLPYDGIQLIDGVAYNNGQAYNGEALSKTDSPNYFAQNYMSIVASASYPINEMLEVYGALGMVTLDDPLGTEFDLGLNCKIVDGLTFNPVLALGQTGKGLEPEIGGKDQTNMVYMLGGLLKAEF